MDENTDAQLLAAFEDTDDLSYVNALLNRHLAGVRGLIFAMVLNETDADDLTQEVFLKAFDNLQGFKKKARFSTWIYRIAMNTAKDFLRHKERKPLDCNLTDALRHGNSYVKPVDSLISQEIISDIEEAIADLSPKLRSAIVLTAMEGLSIREAARIEQSLTATMYWRVHQARKKLRQELGKHLEHL